MPVREYIPAEEQVGGGTLLNFVQSPYPPVTQILKNGQRDEWIALQQDGLHLVGHDGVSEKWEPRDFRGYPSTGWGGEVEPSGVVDKLAMLGGGFRAVSSSSNAGSKSSVDRDDETNGLIFHTPRSTIATGFTSFLFQSDMTLGDQMFFISSPDWLMYLLAGCPNFDPNHTPLQMHGKCPRREMKKGNFKVRFNSCSFERFSFSKLTPFTPPSS